MTPQTILLWDIDGTVVLTGKAGEYAMDKALSRLGLTGSVHDVDYPGRTDRMVCRMLLEHHGMPVTDKSVGDFVEAYLEALALELPSRQGEVLPGILDILKSSHENPNCTNALLTGNMHHGAQLKLSHYDVWNFFEFGAFADDSMDRDALGPIALDRATAHLGTPPDKERVFVIGDTPHDIRCGEVIGARTVAVSTGSYDCKSLAACHPDHLFENFRDYSAFLNLLN